MRKNITRYPSLTSAVAVVMLVLPWSCHAFISSPPKAIWTPPSTSSIFMLVKKNIPSSNRRIHSIATALSNNQNTDSNDNITDNERNMDPVTKASWYAVEAFGKLFGSNQDNQSNRSALKEEALEVDLTKAPSSLQEAFRRIEEDNKRSYFLSGQVDVLAYDPDCIFADPFVSFTGRDRFVENLANLGSFITNYEARTLNYRASADESMVETKIMVKLELNLPWKPILAWPWGVTYTIDPNTCLITKHVESWDIAPMEVSD